jgi:hypothetical protein
MTKLGSDRIEMTEHRAGVRYGIGWQALLCLGALTACGGGADTPASGAPAETRQAPANAVFGIDGPEVTTNGDFQRVPSYLSSGPRVLVSAAQGSASVKFNTPVPKRGFYDVFAWLPQGKAEYGVADVTVHHAGGSTTVGVDQRLGAGEWLSVGVFELNPGTAGVVFSKSGSARLVVDAVRLQWVGEQRPNLELRAESLTVGMKDQAYRSALSIIGGVAPFEYSVSGGSLPPGIELASDQPVLSGRAAKSGRYGFEVSVRDATGARVSAQFEIVIADSAGDESAAPGMFPPTPSSMRERALDTPAGPPDLSNLLGHIATMPEGSWSKVNLNSYSDVWVPADLRPLFRTSNPTPSRIILAWSSFAWDSNRATLWLYGGGHANYSGNEVYLWRAASRMWERASLPSQMVKDALDNTIAIDGVDKAPASSHTYDNNLFLPKLDRMLVLGGAAVPFGGHFLTENATTHTSRKTGPYLFDPARAHPGRVGGSTGSHVQRVAPFPDVVGGNMWSNRESWLNASATSAPPGESFVNGCTGYAAEGGFDVAYIRTRFALFRYRILDLASASSDRWEKVGRFYTGGSGEQATCSYDDLRKTFVTTNRNSGAPFAYWNLETAGPKNNEVYFTPADASGEFAQLLSSNAIDIRYCGIDFDRQRANHKLWCGDGRVWTLTPPATLSAQGWTITQDAAPVSLLPSGEVGTGILGKWKYIPNLDVFMGLQDAVLGNIWVYKPVGWTNPSGSNLPPTVSIDSPATGATFEKGRAIELAASANDSDGSVAKVEFFADGIKIGESAAPHSMQWTGAALGDWALTAVATDDQGARRTSNVVTISVVPPILVNPPPSVSITQPAPDAAFPAGVAISLTADADDSDGSISKVEFFAGTTKVGETGIAPYTVPWTPALPGLASISAVATDDRGATTASQPVVVTIAPGTGVRSVTIQRGSLQGALVRDLYLSSYHKTLNFGTVTNLQDQREYYSSMLRFAIFQSEGGPVPDGARIHSAVLSIYKYSAYNMLYGLHRVLQDWSETTATWTQRSTGLAWSGAGANGAGSDYAAAPDATAETGWDPEWIEFDLTAALAGMSNETARVNYGWRLLATKSSSNLKRIYASDFAADPSLRPKLAITYE